MSTITAETLELLASKICHDLISPIGAVNNGIEIFEEMGADAGPEVTDLISASAQQASAKLMAYRVAYGAGGADGNIKAADIHGIIQSIVEKDNKINQSWSPQDRIGPELPPRGFFKMLISVLLLGMDCLPKGGSLAVHANDEGQTVVFAEGPDAKLKEGFGECLSQSLSQDQLKPQMTHAYVTGLLSAHYGFSIAAESGDNQAAFTITLPAL